jgi:hypothetical protein
MLGEVGNQQHQDGKALLAAGGGNMASQCPEHARGLLRSYLTVLKRLAF